MKGGVGIFRPDVAACTARWALPRGPCATRDATARGQFLEVSLYDTQISWLVNAATNTLVSGKAPRRLGNRHPTSHPTRPTAPPTAISWWRWATTASSAASCATLGLPRPGRHPRFRQEFRPARESRCAEPALIFGGSPVSSRPPRWPSGRRGSTPSRCPSGPVASVPEALENEHTLAREMVVSMPSRRAARRCGFLRQPAQDGGHPGRLRTRAAARSTPIARRWLRETLRPRRRRDRRPEGTPAPSGERPRSRAHRLTRA